jgi:hypothetical protein
LISDFASNSIIDYEKKGYGYATMKVDACISMGFFGNKRFTAKPNPQVHLVNNIEKKRVRQALMN